MARRSIRILFRLGVVLLWLALVPLALELVGYGRYLYRLQTNPYVEAYASGWDAGKALEDAMLAMNGEIPIPVPLQPAAALRFPSLTEKEQQISDTIHGLAGALEKESDWYRFFYSLDEEQRTFAACLRGEVVVGIDKNGRVTHIHGPREWVRLAPYLRDHERYPPLQRFQETGAWLAALSSIPTNAGTPLQSELLPIEGSFLPYPCAITVVKSPDSSSGTIAHLFHRVAWQAAPAPDDSRWAIPYFRYKPNHVEGDNFQTNSHGFRDEEIVLPKPRDTFRILCLGTSTTEEGYRNETTYPNNLERLLNRHYPNQRIEVINCGIPGANTGTHIVNFCEYLSLEPDLVLVYDGVNDVLTLALQFWRQLEANRCTRALSYSPLALEFGWRYLLPPDQAADIFLTTPLWNIDFLHRAFGAHQVPMIASTIAAPNIDRLTPEEAFFLDYNFPGYWWMGGINFRQYHAMLGRYNDLLHKMGEETGLHVIDTAAVFDGTLDKFTDFCHMHQTGINEKSGLIFAQIAETVGAELKRKGTP